MKRFIIFSYKLVQEGFFCHWQSIFQGMTVSSHLFTSLWFYRKCLHFVHWSASLGSVKGELQYPYHSQPLHYCSPYFLHPQQLPRVGNHFTITYIYVWQWSKYAIPISMAFHYRAIRFCLKEVNYPWQGVCKCLFNTFHKFELNVIISAKPQLSTFSFKVVFSRNLSRGRWSLQRVRDVSAR